MVPTCGVCFFFFSWTATGIEAEAEGGLQPSGAGGTHSTASNFGGQDESMLAVDTSLEAETPAKRSASSDRAPKSPTPREDQGATETKADKDGDVPMPDKAAAAGTAGDRSGPSSPQHPTVRWKEVDFGGRAPPKKWVLRSSPSLNRLCHLAFFFFFSSANRNQRGVRDRMACLCFPARG